jgi:hypothetical protein
VKKTEKGDVMTRFWYTLKNLDHEISLWCQSRFFMDTCQLNNMDTIKSISMALREYYITNLISHDLIMEIVQKNFIHNSYVLHINIVH